MTREDVEANAEHAGGAAAQELDPLRSVDFSKLERQLMKPRAFLSMLLSSVATAMTLFALIPLFSVLLLLIWRGGRKLSLPHSRSFLRCRSRRAADLETRSSVLS